MELKIDLEIVAQLWAAFVAIALALRALSAGITALAAKTASDWDDKWIAGPLNVVSRALLSVVTLVRGIWPSIDRAEDRAGKPLRPPGHSSTPK